MAEMIMHKLGENKVISEVLLVRWIKFIIFNKIALPDGMGAREYLFKHEIDPSRWAIRNGYAHEWDESRKA